MKLWCVRGRGSSVEAVTWVEVELLSVQILVVVAIIQMRTLKAEVEKGSMRTVIGHGLLGPKT
jgi:hypothetical protein